MFLSGIVLALCINSLVYVGRAASFNNLTNHSINDAGVSDLLLSTVSTCLYFGFDNVRENIFREEGSFVITFVGNIK